MNTRTPRHRARSPGAGLGCACRQSPAWRVWDSFPPQRRAPSQKRQRFALGGRLRGSDPSQRRRRLPAQGMARGVHHEGSALALPGLTMEAIEKETAVDGDDLVTHRPETPAERPPVDEVSRDGARRSRQGRASRRRRRGPLT